MKSLTHSFTALKYFYSFLGISLFAIIFSLFGSNLAQNSAAMIGILTFGVLHGANDLKIIAKKSSNQSKRYRLKFFILYVGVVLLGIVLFLFIPKIALLSFVGVSCYHFGEQHWNGRFQTKINLFIFYSMYGALIFFLLFTFQFESTVEVIYQITSLKIPFAVFLGGLILVSLGFMLIIIRSKISLFSFLPEFLLLGVLAILFSQATLLFGFGLYFVLWHSLPSLSSQIRYIYDQQTKSPWLSYLKSAIVYWLLALSGLGLFYFYFDLPQEQYLSIFFSFLAAITFPHAVVMGLMFHSRGTNEE